MKRTSEQQQQRQQSGSFKQADAYSPLMERMRSHSPPVFEGDESPRLRHRKENFQRDSQEGEQRLNDSVGQQEVKKEATGFVERFRFGSPGSRSPSKVRT